MFSESIFHSLTRTPAEPWYGANSWPNTPYAWSNIPTQKGKFDPEKCYFKAFPSTPSNQDLQHFNGVHQLKESRNSKNTKRSALQRPINLCELHCLKKGWRQENLSPVEMVSAMLCEPHGFFSACWLASHIQACRKQGHPLLGVHRPRYLTHRKGHQIAFLLRAMP